MSETVLTWIVFILAFGGLVFIHEFGHFIAARMVNVEVEEFGFGLPFFGGFTLFTWKGTRFSFNWFLPGGFVRPKGENDPSIEGGLAAASPWKRLFVLAAGPFMNLFMALLIMSLVITMVGGVIADSNRPETFSQVLVVNVDPNGPAGNAGLLIGDILVSANGNRLSSEQAAVDMIISNQDKPIEFDILRGDEKIRMTITPTYNTDYEKPIIGINMCTACEFKYVTTVSDNIKYSLQLTGGQIYSLATLPVRLIQGALPAGQARLIGLKGIFDIMTETISSDVETNQSQPAQPSTTPNPYSEPIQTLALIGSLSISLGIFNLFPFPAIDGGRIIFLIPELFFKKRVPHEFENLVHGIGLTFLMLLMIYVNVMDFIKPITSGVP